jgi:hypothetical protein
MPLINNFIVCADDCDTPLAIVVEDIDPTCPPAPLLAEIDTLLLMHPTLGAPPADWTVTADWATAIDNADITDGKIKQLSVIGSIPAAERPEVTMPSQTIIYREGTYTATFQVRSLPKGVYDYLQKLQCGRIKPKFWYTSLGGYMYGTSNGIQSNSIQVNFIKEAGAEAYDSAEIVLQWKAETDPLRIDNPLA